jgi:hypothetical protein
MRESLRRVDLLCTFLQLLLHVDDQVWQVVVAQRQESAVELGSNQQQRLKKFARHHRPVFIHHDETPEMTVKRMYSK